MVEKAFKAWDPKAPAAAPVSQKAAPKGKAAKPAPVEEDDDMDLFGDDNEDEKAAAAEAKAKIEAAKNKKKPKKTVIAQSLVMFEVKPLDDQTNLDDLAKRIFKELAMPASDEKLLEKLTFCKSSLSYVLFM